MWGHPTQVILVHTLLSKFWKESITLRGLHSYTQQFSTQAVPYTAGSSVSCSYWLILPGLMDSAGWNLPHSTWKDYYLLGAGEDINLEVSIKQSWQEARNIIKLKS